MKNKHVFSLGIVLMSIFCSGCGTFIGTTINTTISPEFNAKECLRFYTNTGDNMFFLDRCVDDFFEKSNLLAIDKPFEQGDILVFVTGHKGFSLPPVIGHNLNLIYTHPRLVNLEIQDAITKKQLLLCVYKSGFFSMCSYPECRKMISEELEKAFEEARKHGVPPLTTKEKSLK